MSGFDLEEGSLVASSSGGDVGEDALAEDEASAQAQLGAAMARAVSSHVATHAMAFAEAAGPLLGWRGGCLSFGSHLDRLWIGQSSLRISRGAGISLSLSVWCLLSSLARGLVAFPQCCYRT